jgi:hypothetical protein
MQLPPRIWRDHEWGGERVDSYIVISKNSFGLFFKKERKIYPSALQCFRSDASTEANATQSAMMEVVNFMLLRRN